MRNTQNGNNWALAILLIALAALITYQSSANRQAPPAPAKPSAIATFDLEKTFNALEEKKAADAVLLKMAEDMHARGEEQSKIIKQMQADLQDHQPGSAKYRELSDALTKISVEYRGYVEFAKAKIDIERARTLKRIYLNIREAVELFAKQHGYSVVFVDDSIAEIPPGNEEDTNRQISARRMVYTSDEVDITEALIERMNSAFQAAGGPLPAPAPQIIAPKGAGSGASSNRKP